MPVGTHAKVAALDGRIRARELEQPLRQHARAELVEVAIGEVAHAEFGGAGFFAFVNGAVRRRVRCHGRVFGALRFVRRHGESGDYPPTSHVTASSSSIDTGPASARPSSMTEPPASLKRPAANQATARGRMMCSPMWTRAVSDSLVSPA